MRVFVTSDLHLLGNEPGGDQAAIKMARYICTNGTSEDVLLLLGDYGNSLPAIQQCLKLFFDFRGKKLVVFGNHDLWEEEPNTFFRLEQLIALAENMDFTL